MQVVTTTCGDDSDAPKAAHGKETKLDTIGMPEILSGTMPNIGMPPETDPCAPGYSMV